MSESLSPGLLRQVDSKVRGSADPLPKRLRMLKALGTVAPSSCPERLRTGTFTGSTQLGYTLLIKPHKEENTTATDSSRGSFESDSD